MRARISETSSLPYAFVNAITYWRFELMSKQTRWALPITLVLLTALVSPSTSIAAESYAYSTTPSPYVEGTDEAANLFDPLDVSNIQLDVEESIVDYFRYCCNWEYEGPWREAQLTMTLKGETVGPLLVGFHLKGAWGSWRNIDGKPGIKIKVDAFVKNQTIFGVKKLILNNMVQEGSAFNQQLTMRLFRAMEVPASRTGYTRLRINDSDYGLYTLIESLDRVSLPRWFESTEHLYKGGVPYHYADLYPWDESVFQVETGDKEDRSDLMPLLQANVADDWWTEINKVADMQTMVREWAVEQTVGHWDGYAYNGNNYFLHVDENGLFTMMPWGVDQTWGSPIDYLYPNKIMVQKCIQTSECYAMYLQAVADATYAIKSLDLDGMAAQILERINPELETDYRREWWYQDTLWQQEYIRWSVDNNYDWAMGAYIQNGLSEMRRFDSALADLVIEGTDFVIPISANSLPQITLPAGTTEVDVDATARQRQADVEISGNTQLVPGSNQIRIDVTSQNGQSEQSYVIDAYVLSKATKSLTLATVGAKDKLTEQSFVRLHNSGVMASIKVISDFQVTVSGQKTSGTSLLNRIVKILKDAGMPTPSAKKYVKNPNIRKGNIKITFSYLK